MDICITNSNSVVNKVTEICLGKEQDIFRQAFNELSRRFAIVSIFVIFFGIFTVSRSVQFLKELFPSLVPSLVYNTPSTALNEGLLLSTTNFVTFVLSRVEVEIAHTFFERYKVPSALALQSVKTS